MRQRLLTKKHGTISGFTGGKSHSSFCGGIWLVVAYISNRLAMPNRPAKLGNSKLASGIPTGERAGKLNTAQP